MVKTKRTKKDDSVRSVTDTDVKIGQRMRAARLDARVSQETLAARLGITFQQVQKYEKGINRISASRLLAVSMVLARPVAWFLDEDQTRRGEAPPPKVWQALATNEGMALMTCFSGISSPAVRRRILALVQSIVTASDED